MTAAQLPLRSREVPAVRTSVVPPQDTSRSEAQTMPIMKTMSLNMARTIQKAAAKIKSENDCFSNVLLTLAVFFLLCY